MHRLLKFQESVFNDRYSPDRHIRVIFFLVVFSLCFSFPYDIYSALHRYHDFVGVKYSNGIPMSGITALTVDEDGFVWGASRMGIVRATPSSVSSYTLPVSTSDVMQIKLAYNKGELVAASQNGQIFRYNRLTDTFQQWASLTEMLGNKDWISNIVLDDDRVLWISTSKGLFTCKNGVLERFAPDISGYTYILMCAHNELVIISKDAIFRISDKGKLIEKLPGKFDQFVSTAQYDRFKNRILMGTYPGELWEYSLVNKKIRIVESKNLPKLIIRSILVPDSKTFLLGMEGGGIVVFDEATDKVLDIIMEDIDNPSSLNGNTVFAMSTDLQDRLWVATTNGGLQYSDIEGDDIERIQHKYHSTASLLNNKINFILTASDGSLWVATNDGISRRNPEDDSWRHFLDNRKLSVLSLSQDRQGRIYASTYGNGVYVLDPSSGRQLDHFTEKDADIFGNGAYVFSSFTDSDGDIWFGGVKGDIVCYSPENKAFMKYESHPVFCFAEQENGKILSGGGDGLILIDKESGKTETVLAENVVQQILVDGNVWWICTSGNGVIRMDRASGKQSSLTVNDGLHSNFTRSIIKKDNNLWVGTALGMSCYDINKKEMLRLPGKDIFTGNAFRENSASILSDGKLAFGTNNGIVVFRPEKILTHESQGKIFFSDIRVSGRSIRSDINMNLTVPIDSIEELTLDYPSNSFTLSMIPVGNVGSNVMYSWKLENFDKDWTELSSLPFINYINLKKGKYCLKVKMYDGGIVSEREFRIKVNPPFWNTWWFIFLMIIAAVSLIYLYVHRYLVNLQRRHAFEKLLLSLQLAEDIKHPLEIELNKGVGNSHENNLTEGNPTTANGIVAEVADDIEIDDVESNDSSISIIDDEFLARAVECVKDNISNESFGKGEFADAMRVSQSLLYKKIKSMTNMGVVEFIRSIRLNHAMTLLGSGKFNVTEVSEMCGFNSSGYFSRVFKESFGKNPSDILPKS